DLTGPCPCRKPEPGMLLNAARDLGLDLSASWMVGDRAIDVEAGRRAGTHTILVRTGHGGEEEREWPNAEWPLPEACCEDLAAAADWILRPPPTGGRA
ncbi:MAG TPA: HAD hydrolase-like protein, partial [Candidatus Saccharimonadales bacterium]|nr:HAD hydrolase-like protein [Candidatus Saccharimonadales bacterium]